MIKSLKYISVYYFIQKILILFLLIKKLILFLLRNALGTSSKIINFIFLFPIINISFRNAQILNKFKSIDRSQSQIC